MNILHSIVLGIVEGITEFLPISSTFHLIFSAKILGIQQNDFAKLFEVVIQSGAILSVLLLYFTDVVKDREIQKKLIFSFIPTAIVGLILHKIIKDVLFTADYLMLTVFIIVGVIFIVSEYLVKKDKIKLTKELQSFSYKEAIVIGFIQALAVLPGVSRAGSVILGMMFLRFKREDAARYSFMLSVPTILAASALDAFKMRKMLFASSNDMILLAIGFVAAFISSYFVVKWLIAYLQKHTLTVFGWYRIIAGICILAYLLLRLH